MSRDQACVRNTYHLAEKADRMATEAYKIGKNARYAADCAKIRVIELEAQNAFRANIWPWLPM